MNYKDLLDFKPIVNEKNIIKGFVEWDSNDGDYIGDKVFMSPETLFSDQKLIYIIAYSTLPYNFKVKDFDKKIKRNECRFSQYLNKNNDINDIMNILEDADLVCYSNWGSTCHTLVELKMTYYDENGVAKEISFEKIYKEFKGMTYKEICDKINSL